MGAFSLLVSLLLVNFHIAQAFNDPRARALAHTKAYLARRLFLKEDVDPVSVEWHVKWKTIGEGTVKNGTLFKNLDSHYIYNDQSITKLDTEVSDSVTNLPTKLESLQKARSYIAQQMEHGDITYLATCYEELYCDILATTPTMNLRKLQSISVQQNPKKLHFFLHEDSFYLVMVTDYSTIYRWSETYFDEEQVLLTTGALDVDTFYSKGSTIMAFAQNYTDVRGNQQLSRVFAKRNKNFELKQLLTVADPTKVKHYQVSSKENGPQHFLLFLSPTAENQIFWWNFRDVSSWAALPHVKNQKLVFTDEVGTVPFVFIASEKSISIFEATLQGLTFVKTVETDGQTVQLAVKDDMIILISDKIEATYTVSAVEMTVRRPSSGSQHRASLRECIASLEKSLEERDKFLDSARKKLEIVLNKKKHQYINEAKVSGKVVFNDIKIKRLRVNPEGKTLTITPSELRAKIQEYKKKYETLKEKLKTGYINQNRYLVKGDISVKHLAANSLTVDLLNKRRMDDLVSVTKNQSINGELLVQQLKVDHLEALKLNAYSPEDLLQKNLATQSIKGEKTIHSLRANNVTFSDSATINGVKFTRFANTAGGVPLPVEIKGAKTVQEVAAKQLNITYVNKERFEDWYKKMKPDWASAFQDTPALYENLTVGNLLVETINNISWAQILKNIENAKGNSGPKKIKNLFTAKLNGIPFEKFLTKATAQNISSDIELTSMEANHLEFKTLNNFTKEQISHLLQTILYTDFALENGGEANATVLNENSFEIDDSNATAKARSSESHRRKLSELLKTDLKVDLCPKTLRKGMKNVLIYGDLFVENGVEAVRINHVNVATTLPKMILLSHKNATQNITFSDVTAEIIQAKKINQERVSKKRMLKVNGSLILPAIKWSDNTPTELRIKGTQKFKNITHLGQIEGLINGVNFSEFAKTRLSKTKDQLINVAYDVHTIYATNLNAEHVNDIDLNNLVYANNGDISINSDLIFKRIGVKGNITSQKWENCDLKKIVDMDISQIKYFDTLEVLKNLSWNKSLQNTKGLSYIMDKAVTKNQMNIIEAPVFFKGNVSLVYLEAKENINGVDLSSIVEDGIFSSKRKQKIKTEVYLKSPVTVNIADFKSNVMVDTVDGVSIEKLNDNLYRVEDDIVITGHKTFEKGFKAYNLNSGLIHNVKTESFVSIMDLLETNSSQTLPHITFNQLHVLHNMTVDQVNGVNITRLLKDRISLSKNQTIYDEFRVDGGVQILVTMDADKVNDVLLNHTFSINNEDINLEGPLIIDHLEFYVDGDAVVEFMNGANLSKIYGKSIMKDENATLTGNVVFEKGVTVKGNTEVKIINSCDIHDMYEKIANYHPVYVSKALENISKIHEISSQLPRDVLLQYLEHNSTLNLNLENVKETAVSYKKENIVDLHIYGMTDELCGLPEKCLCPRHLTFSINGASKSQVLSVQPNNIRKFQYDSPSLGISVDVETTTVSYSNRCHLKDGREEHTSVRWKKADRSDFGEIALVDGYLSDVKFFKLGDSVYTILAFYYNGNISESRNLNVTVYELRVSKLRFDKIDSIPAKGAVSVDLLWAHPGYFLVIGNTKSEDPASDTVYTEVYRFDERNNKFRGLRKIGSHGVLDLKAVRIKKEAFIFIVQKKPWPLLTFKYSAEFDNFFFFEKFHNRHGFLSVASIVYPGGKTEEVYIGMVLANNEFRILKYKYIEGFVEILSGRQTDVVALESFSLESVQYLLAVSPKPSLSRVLRMVNSP